MSASGKRASLALEASLISAVFFLGTNPVAVKYAIADFPPLSFAATRFIMAGLLLLAITMFLRSRGRAEIPGRKDMLALAAIGIVGVGVNNLLFTLGVSQITASETALIYATPPLWGMLFAFVLGLERPTVRGVAGVAVAIFGVILVVYGGLGKGESTVAGAVMVAVAAACWGSYTVLTLKLLGRYSALTVATFTILFAGIFMCFVSAPSLYGTDWGSVGIGPWLALLYTIGPVAAYGFWAWQNGVSSLGANQVLVYQYLVTLFGVTAGVLLLGEDLGLEKVVGGVVILCGVYVARAKRD